MIVYLNGRFIAEEQAALSIHDRGFLYGDGLFETVRVYHGEPFLWKAHMERFYAGCEKFRLSPPLSPRELCVAGSEVFRRNQLSDGGLRITLSRGPGPRGYSTKGAECPTLLIASFPPPVLPRTFRAINSSLRLPEKDDLAAFKHASRLRQVLARAEANEAGADEALLLDVRGFVMEATSANLFWVASQTVFTPPLAGILPGTTRAHVLQLCNALKIPAREKHIRASELRLAEGVFITSSGVEIMELSHLDGQRLQRSPLVKKLKRAYRTTLP